MGKLWIIFFRFLSHWRLLTSIVSAFEAVGSSFIDCLFLWLWNYKGAQVKGGRSTWEKEQSRMQKIRHEIKKGNENDLTISARQEFYRLWVCVFIFGLLNKKKNFHGNLFPNKGFIETRFWSVKSQRPAAGPSGKHKRVPCPGDDGHFDTLCLGEKRCKLFGKNLH